MTTTAGDALTLGGADYLAPRQVHVGRGTSQAVGASLRAFGTAAGPVFVVADPIVHDNGLLDGLYRGLREADLAPVVFTGISGEPTLEELDEAAASARAASAVAVVGAGGGSSMDVAKLVALLTTNPGDASTWVGAVAPPAPVAPLALLPSTVGTGSEATRIAMVAVEDRKQITSCPQFVPLVAALDPDLVSSLPPHVVAASGMDALAHALESLLSTNRNALTVHAANRAAELILGNIENAVAQDPNALSAMQVGAYYAGLALNAGVVLGHSLAYVIARRTHLPHGVTCALALPYCLAHNDRADPDAVSDAAWAATRGGSGDLWTATREIDALVGRLGLPRSLGEVGIDATEAPAMAEECVRDYPRPNNPVPLDARQLTVLLEAMHRADLEAARGAARPA